ncbi:lysophospholipid acyltransferase family protein [Mariprofundus erugo]|uniref:lysophospholipid acyltransferase family protein n=1 Tax=Mariprofundus erugo TaxID=2528639 RepID=UPI0013C2F587|nr:lysophospholipid acyltransferase family protein [Mariprofundus erugo]
MKLQLITWLIPRLIRIAIYCLSSTIRWEVVGERFRPGTSDQHIFSFWHSRLLMMGVGLKGCKGYTLISTHRDGGFIADTLQLQGFRAIRGSSTRGGGRALIEMIRKCRDEGADIGISPDGPKGPREKVKPGIVLLAKKSGVKICPVIWATRSSWRISSSWDHFYIPKPFTRGVFVFGEPLFIAPDASDSGSLVRVQSAMDTTCQIADSYFI